MYEIQPYTFRKAKQLGVVVKPSQRSNYKIDIFNKQGEYMFSGGDRRYFDYPTYLKEKGEAFADKRRKAYHNRHKGETERGQVIGFLLW
jgi:hypothetical protein